MRHKHYQRIIILTAVMLLSIHLEVFASSNNVTAQDVLNVAASQVKKVTGAPNKYTRWIGKVEGSYSYAWCHAFVSWCGDQAGAQNLFPRTAGCATGASWFKQRGQWKDQGYVPKVGDVIYFNWPGNKDVYDHVAFVSSVSGGKIHTIGGNEGGTVKIDGTYGPYSPYDSRIIGYGIPAYKEGCVPEGCVDEITGSCGEITVRGWTFDRDAPSESLDIHVYVGGPAGSANAVCYPARADSSRPDLSGFGMGTRHGFDVRISTSKTGNVPVYVYAINAGKGSENPLLGNRTVNVKKFPSLTKVNLGEKFTAVIANEGTGKVLTVNTSNDDVISRSYKNLDVQKWLFVRNTDGSYSIQSVSSKKYLDNFGGTGTSGSNVQVYSGNNTSAQKWDIYRAGADSCYLKPKCSSSCVLDLYGSSSAENTEITLYAYHGESNQRFRITETDAAGLTYQAHVADLGWLASVSAGQTAGTVSQSRQMEAFVCNLTAPNGKSGIKYQAHCQNIGWQPFVNSGQIAGTTGKKLRLEAVKIMLCNGLEKKYNVVYRVHIKDKGWLPWVKNGAQAGKTGQSLRVEAIQIRLEKK